MTKLNIIIILVKQCGWVAMMVVSIGQCHDCSCKPHVDDSVEIHKLNYYILGNDCLECVFFRRGIHMQLQGNIKS